MLGWGKGVVYVFAEAAAETLPAVALDKSFEGGAELFGVKDFIEDKGSRHVVSLHQGAVFEKVKGDDAISGDDGDGGLAPEEAGECFHCEVSMATTFKNPMLFGEKVFEDRGTSNLNELFYLSNLAASRSEAIPVQT